MRVFTLLFFLLVAGGLLFCCRSFQELEEWPAGVSNELAKYRKATISDLSYELSFDIPASKSKHIEGDVCIGFLLEKQDEVVLDFREDSLHVKKVVVNGVEVECKLQNEHLIIPRSKTVKGKNEIKIAFIAGDQSLNRNDDFLYTLLVPDRARTLFPCFDQPDLKALFTLSLGVPDGWNVVSNTLPVQEKRVGDRKQVVFGKTEPLSTYLFSFVAGKLDSVSDVRNGRKISIYHRETDVRKLTQLETIFDQVYASLEWLEKYTGVPYPFAKYELIILPGFQYGGMEHTGATLYNDKKMFLSEHPTIDEKLSRMELIAHETAHMWFGDYVTMAWFDDVWTKEVFANYFAARMTEPQFPEVNHKLNALKRFRTTSYAEDRTAGTTAIKQPLDNLNNAGLIYGQIIYNKAPLVMNMLVKLMGEKCFQKGIQEYLTTYAYSNATWDGLIRILDKYTPIDLADWSGAWVNEKGMPEIRVKQDGDRIVVTQQDPYGRGVVWPQNIQLLLIKDKLAGQDLVPGNWVTERIDVQLYDSVVIVEGEKADYILPDANGEGYGYFLMDEKNRDFFIRNMACFMNPVTRLSLIMTLNENMLNGNIVPSLFISEMLNFLKTEKNPLIYSTGVGYVKEACLHYVQGEDECAEHLLLELSRQKTDPGNQLVAFRALLDVFKLPEITEIIFDIWDRELPFDGLQLSEADYMKMAWELCVRFPEKCNYITERQLERIKNPDRCKEFVFICRAVVADVQLRDFFFYQLLNVENRDVEPWVTKALFYLNHPLRQKDALKYIRPSLDILEDIQRTGDIFFPKSWIASCLKGHDSAEGTEIVRLFFNEKPDYPILLKNKVLQSADHLFRLEKQR